MSTGIVHVYVVDSGDYEQNAVYGVYSSLEKAIEETKKPYLEEYVVEWGELQESTDGSGKRTWWLSQKIVEWQGRPYVVNDGYTITEWSIDKGTAPA